jgi:quercetin dioxygenase-like cupin family protein
MTSRRGSSAIDDPVATVQEALACALKPYELSTRQRDDLRARVIQRAREEPPTGTATIRARNGAWIRIAPFIEVKVLRRDSHAGNQTLLMRVQPGGVMPGHRHEQEEELFVLEGECHVGTHKLSAGDAHISAAGSYHEAITTQTGVVVLLRGEYSASARQ